MNGTENSQGEVQNKPKRAGRPRKRTWKNTRAALGKLENLLKCKLCSNQLKEPTIVGSCEHTFCKECADDFSGKHCPECNLPVQAKEQHRDVTMSNFVNYTNQLKAVVTNNDTESSNDNSESGSDCNEAPNSPKPPTPKKFKPNETNGHGLDSDKGLASPTSSMRSSKRRTGLRTTSPKNEPKENKSNPNFGLKLKRNIKGETPLHLAAIKGDVITTRRLLHQGANPNDKDYAGWTPLHEACNHGHKFIVEILLDNGALIDIPACENETPLHDAVSMGKIDIVTLLVERGANVNARNSAGITPMDMAKTNEMKDALNTPTNPPSSGQSSKSSNLVPKIEDMVLLKTGLNSEQENELMNCAKILNAAVVETFSEDVTHLICVCDDHGHCQRTMKFLQAILCGTWILNYTWVEECIAFKRKVFEEPFEVVGNKMQPKSFGPKRSRVNKEQQFPPLFDGCSFYFHGSFEFPSPSRDNLIMLVKLGGGTVLNREPRPSTITTTHTVPYHAFKDENGDTSAAYQFIIFQDTIPQRLKNTCDKYIRCVKFGWFLNCITTYQILPPEPS